MAKMTFEINNLEIAPGEHIRLIVRNGYTVIVYHDGSASLVKDGNRFYNIDLINIAGMLNDNHE